MARGRLRAIVSSASKVKITRTHGARTQKPEWQKVAFGFYDTLGEIWYASQFYSRTLSKLVLKPMYLNDEGEAEDTDDPAAWAVLDRVQDPQGGRSQLQSQYGKLRFLIGESYLFCTLDPDTGAEVWEILSPFELEVTDGMYIRKKRPKDEGTRYRDAGDDALEATNEATAVAWRLWVRHPQYSALADSPMRAVLDECEELSILGHAVRAGARSRLTGPGILWIPDDISPLPHAGPNADENAVNDPFMDDLTTAMVTPIGDEGTAAAVVPMLVRANGNSIEQVKWMPLSRPEHSQKEREERRECIERIALGLDLPPEILLGVTDANHWTAWQIDEDAWKAHVQPVADAMVADLTSAYFRPSLQKMGHANADRFVIGYDASDVVRRPDKSGDGFKLHDRFVISDEALLRTTGFEPTDAPTPQEIAARLARAAGTGSGAAPASPVKQDAPTPKAPPEPDEEATIRLHDRVGLTAELMVERARELAGSRVRTKLAKQPDWLAWVRHVPNRSVCATLAANIGHLPDTLGDPDQLVAGGAEFFAAKLTRWGIPPDTIDAIIRVAEEHARDTLLQAEPGPPPLEMAKLLAVARMAV